MKKNAQIKSIILLIIIGILSIPAILALNLIAEQYLGFDLNKNYIELRIIFTLLFSFIILLAVKKYIKVNIRKKDFYNIVLYLAITLSLLLFWALFLRFFELNNNVNQHIKLTKAIKLSPSNIYLMVIT